MIAHPRTLLLTILVAILAVAAGMAVGAGKVGGAASSEATPAARSADIRSAVRDFLDDETTSDSTMSAAQEWLSQLPRQAKVQERDIDVDAAGGFATVSMEVVLRTDGFQPEDGERIEHELKTPLTLHLERGRDTDWDVISATYPREGLAVLDEPRVVSEDGITIVFDEDERDEAEFMLPIAEEAREGIIEQFGDEAHETDVTIYLVDDEADADRLNDHESWDTVGYVTHRSDVMFLTSILGRFDATDTRSVIWHELTHVFVMPMTDELPSMLREGIAEDVAVSAIWREQREPVDLSWERANAIEHEVDFTALLDDMGTEAFYDDDPDVEAAGYHVGFATIRWIRETRGDAALEEFLEAAAADGGSDASREVLGLRPDELGAAVDLWIRANREVRG